MQIDGSQLTRPIDDGPVVCANDSEFLCYRPARRNNLHITQAPLPDTGVSPASGAASGGTGVTLKGVDFTGATDVMFGSVVATSVNVVDSTTITAVTPAHAIGPVDVMITTPNGPETYTDGYTYETTAVGQPAFGGTIACLNGGLNDLIAARADNSPGIPWGVQKYIEAISTSDGAANTVKIVDCLTNSIGCTNPPTPIGIDTYAAGICSTYEVDSQGNTPCKPENACYDDWFLPAVSAFGAPTQLNCLYANQAEIGGFTTSEDYWSSTEFGGDEAYIQGFGSGLIFEQNKLVSEHTRCVSVFTP